MKYWSTLGSVAVIVVTGLPAVAQQSLQKLDTTRTPLETETLGVARSLPDCANPAIAPSNSYSVSCVSLARNVNLPEMQINIPATTVEQQLPQTQKLFAQVPPVNPIDTTPTQTRRSQSSTNGDPDVLLDVPNLSVDEITLKVNNLRAHVSLDAKLANLLSLTAGADASIEKVDLTIKGVKAQVLLKVKLDNVASIIDRTLTTIDRNPQILERLLQSVDKTVGTVGNVANTALQPGGVVGQTLNNVTQPGGLLNQTVNTLGQTVQRTVDSTGNIVESTLNNTGGLLNQKTVGNLLSLPVLNQTTNSAGQIVRRVQDNSGAIIEYTLDAAGRISKPQIIRQASGGQ